SLVQAARKAAEINKPRPVMGHPPFAIAAHPARLREHAPNGKPRGGRTPHKAAPRQHGLPHPLDHAGMTHGTPSG
ncbi:hypothetical protein, partial [Albidovulum sp.]|uniref:hypothetical protein n=1 Tax=Albidovulum sp. TaxID=1872424 RepID=UPI0039B8FD47